MELIDYFRYIFLPGICLCVGFLSCNYLDKYGLSVYRKYVKSQDNYICTLQEEVEFLRKNN